MFLDALLSSNANFVDVTLSLYQAGKIPPNSYVVDVDQVSMNAKCIAQSASANNMLLYFMTKQIGRNPVLSQAIAASGIDKAVAVDPMEALQLAENGVKLGHVGHLVQVPDFYMEQILRHRPEVVTVFTVESAKRVSRVAASLHQEQNLLLRVVRPGDTMYDAQEGGFLLNELEAIVKEIQKLPCVKIVGVTSFPSLLVQGGAAVPTQNLETLRMAAEQLSSLGVHVEQVNAPSVTCSSTIPLLQSYGATHGEPGHALTGTTPLHADGGQPELPSYLYISEVSHRFNKNSYVYGGGFYSRGHLKQALVGPSVNKAQFTEVLPLNPESIDYYLRLAGEFPVGTPAVFAFRTQIFATRATVVPVTGVQSGTPTVAGIYSAEGKRIG